MFISDRLYFFGEKLGRAEKQSTLLYAILIESVLIDGFYLLPISDNGKDPILKNCCCLSVVAAKFHTNPSICQWLLIGLLIEYFRAIK